MRRTKGVGPQAASALQRQRREHSLRNSKKKRGPTPSQFDASSPHRRGQQQGDGRNTYQSSPSRQNDAAVRQPKKSRGPTLCSLAAFTPYWGDLMFARAHHLRHRHKRPLRRGVWTDTPLAVLRPDCRIDRSLTFGWSKRSTNTAT